MAEQSAQPAGLELSEQEQWRLINESGVLKQVPKSKPDDKETELTLAEEILDAFLYIIPFSFLLLMMEILVHHQYGKQPTLNDLKDRMVSSVPIMSVFIFYTSRYKNTRRMQFLLFLLGLLSGARMMYVLARSGFLKVMRQCPPLATLWIYTVVQMDLGPAVLNIVLVGGYVWIRGLKVTR